jgi:hypothetical protein
MMNRIRSMARYLAPILATALLLLVAASLAAAQETPPQIPHPLEGRDACLVCHETGAAGAPKVPADHVGRTNEMCRGCHQPAMSTEAVPTETAPAPEASATSSAAETAEASEGPPAIPHPLAGRDDCLACHREGIGGAPQIPPDHAGRTNDICQGCHQPEEAAEVTPTPAPITNAVPTRIAHPAATAGVNTCADCHAQLGGTQAAIAEQWHRSIHSERDVSCADCHGGDPTATSPGDAMSPAAGFVGVPAKSAIPALCASCHADVELMRQFNLPTDQYAQYNESVHGKLLAEGDTNVTTCYDCHGGHEVLPPDDPASSVYPANVPALCSGCHSNEELMAPYHIPTDQYALYMESVHGQALIDKQDFRAPTCATCHGTHGAAPPGITEVANVCGTCHGATQDYYLESAHAQGGEAAPKCVTCHGNHDVTQPTDALLTGTEPGHCDACHTPDSPGGEVAQSISAAFDSTTQAYANAENSIESAKQLGMLVTGEESDLQQANTAIITARAAQHTLDSDTVLKSLNDALKSAESARAGAAAAIAQSNLRRRAMLIVVVVIALIVVALYLLKRQLDRRLSDQTRN